MVADSKISRQVMVVEPRMGSLPCGADAVGNLRRSLGNLELILLTKDIPSARELSLNVKDDSGLVIRRDAFLRFGSMKVGDPLEGESG